MSSLSNTKIQSILVKLFLLTSFFFPWQLLQPGRGEYYIIMGPDRLRRGAHA